MCHHVTKMVPVKVLLVLLGVCGCCIGRQGPCSGISCLVGCPEPKEYPEQHIIPIHLDNSYAIGASVVYACEHKFRYKKGFPVSRCLNDGTWSIPDVLCVPSCGQPPDIEHTEHDSGTYGDKPGSLVTYWCEEGYGDVRRSEMKYYCAYDTTGKWEVQGQRLLCKKMCHPIIINNGYVHPRGPIMYNGSITIHCQPGYQLRGLQTMLCSEDGQWEGAYPRCEEILCQWPSDPINGYILEKNNCVNTTIIYKCNNGYNVTGDGLRTCKENGHWEGEEVCCQAVDCGQPHVPLGICNTSSGTTYLKHTNCSCIVGTKANFNLYCNHNGKWSPPYQDKCHKECAIHFQANRIKHNSERKCTCRADYVKCFNGSWFPNLSMCFPECDEPRLLNGIIRKYNSHQSRRRSIGYSCNKGYHLEGPASAECNCYGEWIPPTIPTCEKSSEEAESWIDYQADTEDATVKETSHYPTNEDQNKQGTEMTNWTGHILRWLIPLFIIIIIAVCVY